MYDYLVRSILLIPLDLCIGVRAEESLDSWMTYRHSKCMDKYPQHMERNNAEQNMYCNPDQNLNSCPNVVLSAFSLMALYTEQD